jgi:hypothetical protein
MRRLQVFFREKHGIELEQRAGDLTEIIMKECQDVKVKVQLMKMLSAFKDLSPPEDWSRVFH